MGVEKILRILPEESGSNWTKDSDKIWDEFKAFRDFDQKDQLTDKILKFLIARYSQKSNPQKMLKPENLVKWLAQLLEALEHGGQKLTLRQGRLLKTNIKRIVKNMHQTLDFSVRRPKFLTIKKLKELSIALWKNHRGKRKPETYLAASIIVIMTWLSAARVIDVARLKWRDLKRVNNSTGKFLTCKVRFSKSNPNRPQSLTFMRNKDPVLDVIYRLEKWAEKTKSKTGFIFRDITKNDSHLATHQIVNAMRLAARDLGWPEENWPRGHSGRNSCVPTLMQLGQKTAKINVFLRWAHGSTMLSHYMADSLECSTGGSAFLLTKALEEGKLEKYFKDK